MNTKRFLFGIMACAVLTLTAISCTPNTADDDLYENSIDKKTAKKEGREK